MIGKNIKLGQKAFTLMEVLVVVIVLATLVTMAVPMYERSIEKSHRAEVSVTLSQLCEAKMRTMINMDIIDFKISPQSFEAKHLDGDFAQSSKNFHYSLAPNPWYSNAVCAVRSSGKNAGTAFLYFCGDPSENGCDCSTAEDGSICKAFCGNKKERFFCMGKKCDTYGMDNMNFETCDEVW